MSVRATISAFGRLQRSNTAFFVCDIQEKFRTGIHAFPSLVSVAQKMIKAANVLEVPYIITEQYPKGLGNTVPELDVENAAAVVPKTKFSMLVPEVETKLKEFQTKSVVIFGIERLSKAGAHIASSETVIFQLTESASDPKFKQISALVKEYQQAARENALLFKDNVSL
ncbi:hypothetical protein H4219_000300 [Mycoemilia scoparia]|uniref:Isochorismatase-like domain-containing protein n=1 Tax=Mycoemilia scoparia TaxID=417184 RepID=A0A9W8DRP8_9FUNG|nr:hypothetical protein H4219_000300 [Mycoemilia scoparia]